MTLRRSPRRDPDPAAFVNQHHADAESYAWTIAQHGAARIAHGSDGRAYLVQKRQRSGWWRIVEACPSRRALLFVVQPAGAEGDGGPVVRSDFLRAVAERLPAAPEDFDGAGVSEAMSEAIAALGVSGLVVTPDARKPKANRPQKRGARRTSPRRVSEGHAPPEAAKAASGRK